MPEHLRAPDKMEEEPTIEADGLNASSAVDAGHEPAPSAARTHTSHTHTHTRTHTQRKGKRFYGDLLPNGRIKYSAGKKS